jgi:hypothetical protein
MRRCDIPLIVGKGMSQRKDQLGLLLTNIFEISKCKLLYAIASTQVKHLLRIYRWDESLNKLVPIINYDIGYYHNALMIPGIKSKV